jgi:hypothetical protein
MDEERRKEYFTRLASLAGRFDSRGGISRTRRQGASDSLKFFSLRTPKRWFTPGSNALAKNSLRPHGNMRNEM